jgi:hypothetical protein
MPGKILTRRANHRYLFIIAEMLARAGILAAGFLFAMN